MYVNLRRYPRIAASKEAIAQAVEDELLPELRKEPGFKGYCAFRAEDDSGVSVSVFADRDAAHRSTDAARQWVMRHQDFFPERGEEFYGECFAHEGPHGAEQGAGESRRSLFVLVRELDGLPGTQDTRAFVEQRTLPMIARSPGFQGVYMVRSDRDPSKAAVVTLFEDREHAVAAHAKAVELLKEGLPKASVTRVVQGQSTVLTVGG